MGLRMELDTQALELLMGQVYQALYRKDLVYGHSPGPFCNRDQIHNNCFFKEALVELSTPRCDGIIP